MIRQILELIQDIIVPENNEVQKLLAIPHSTLRELLPKSPVNIKDIFILFNYQNKKVKFIVKAIKYKNNASLRKRIAGYLYEELLDIISEITLFEGKSPLLTPMPMSKTENRKRGFNQCEEICKEIKKMGEENIIVSYNVLKKIRETERQTNLNKEKRMKNVKNSMLAKNPTIHNQTVIVFDDVYTTGATFTEAKRALLAGGARRVIGIFVAH
ncbi:MAG: ComF family protein [Parcubacteria group bacterium]|nr:ComF family protein [Parcubacteria group bacterium]